jgi:membrane-associated phospholipid phosphatase
LVTATKIQPAINNAQQPNLIYYIRAVFKLNLHKSYLAVLFALLVCFESTAQNLDIDILRNINHNRNTALDLTFKTVTNSVFPMAIGVPAAITTLYLLNKDSANKQRAIIIGGTLIISSAITGLLKYSIQRERPFVTYPDIKHIKPEDSYSFPSGHTSTAFALATSVTIAYPKWYVAAPAYLWASSAAYSRMHLGVHYPSDVVLGAAFGVGGAFISNWLNKKMRSKKTKELTHQLP